MTAVLLPQGKQQYFTNTGAPLADGTVSTFDTGTTTPRTTWADAAQTAPNPNPIILDARGEATVFWSGAYRVLVKDSLGNTIWTVDGVSDQNYTDTQLRADLANAASAVLGADLVGFDATVLYTGATVGGFLASVYGKSTVETSAGATIASYAYPRGDPRRAPTFYVNQNWLDYGDVPTYISATSFSVPGDQTARYPEQSRVRLVGGGGASVIGRVATSVFGAVTTITIAVDSGSVPNPSYALYKAMALNSTDPGTVRWDLNTNSGPYIWNVNNGNAATGDLHVFCGTGANGSGLKIAAVQGNYAGEYLPASGYTGRVVVLHTGQPIPILFGTNDQLKMVCPASITDPLRLYGATNAMMLVSPRTDDLGGTWFSFVENDTTTRKGYMGFANDATNNTMLIVNEEATSSVQIVATAAVILQNAGGNVGAVYTDSTISIGIYTGAGSPNGVITANPGSIYQNKTGGAVVSIYVKESGAGNVGWVAK